MSKKTIFLLYGIIPPTKKIVSDFRKNFKKIVVVILIYIIYVLSSSFICYYFEPNWSYLHSTYFTIINTSTVGFGDVVPQTHSGKIMACINAFFGLMFFGVIVAMTTMAFQPTPDKNLDQKSASNNTQQSKANHKTSTVKSKK
jgi:hypothetical protein